jgi:hypothetical protein
MREVIGSLMEIAAAAGLLGFIVFGLLEAAKCTWLGTAGFGRIRLRLGSDLFSTLAAAYGPDCEQQFLGRYRLARRGDPALGESLRQGIVRGLNEANALSVARALGVVEPYELATVAALRSREQQLTVEERGVITRFEVAVDARVDLALSDARIGYAGTLRLCSIVLAILIAELAAPLLGFAAAQALLVGIAAVPMAMVTHDLVSTLRAVRSAANRQG